MATVIGESIKQLRRKKGITQEALSRHLGISCQAVSKWERGESSPDLSLIVPIANFFCVTTDELLGVSSARQEEKVTAYMKDYDHLDAEGKTIEKFDIVQKAYAEYPNDHRVMDLYLTYLCEDPEVDDGFLAHRIEILRISSQLLQECSIEKIRYHAMEVSAQIYYLDGEDDKAIAVLSDFPAVFKTKNMLLSLLFENGSVERLKHSRASLCELLEAMVLQVRHIALEDTAFNRVEQISLLRKAISLIDLFVTNDDYGFFHYDLSDLYFWLANRYVMTENPDAAIENVRKAFSHAKAYDALPETMTHTSPLLQGVVFDRSAHGDAGKECKVASQLRYLNETCNRLYAPLMDRPAMQQIFREYTEDSQ